MKKIFVVLVLALLTMGVNAQDIKGNWQMYKNVDRPIADSNEEYGESKTA